MVRRGWLIVGEPLLAIRRFSTGGPTETYRRRPMTLVGHWWADSDKPTATCRPLPPLAHQSNAIWVSGVVKCFRSSIWTKIIRPCFARCIPVTTRFGNLSHFETGTSHFATSMVLSWDAHLETHTHSPHRSLVGLHSHDALLLYYNICTCSISHPISFNDKASFIYHIYLHVLRALTFSQLPVIHVLQADPHNRIPACSLDIASVTTLRSRLLKVTHIM